jgi:hypothetical protein
MSISSDDDSDSTEPDGDHDSELNAGVDMRMEDDVDAPNGDDLDGDVDMDRDGDDDDEEDEEEEDDKEEEVLDVDKAEDKDQEEDKDEDDGKEHGMIGQGEMLNTSAADVDTMVDDQPIVLPEQGQEMRGHTPRPQPPVSAPWPQYPEPRPWPRTQDTHPLSGMEHLGLVMLRKPRPAVPTFREVEAAGNTSDVDVHQQLLCQSGCGNSPPDVTLPNVPLPDVIGKV